METPKLETPKSKSKCKRCGNCGEINPKHLNINCPHLRGICNFCNKGIHKSKDCPYKLWHLFKHAYPEVNCWKKTLNERFSINNRDFNYFDNRIKERKYKFVDYNFILYTIKLYDDILVTENTKIDSWINILNRFHFIKTCIEK